MLIQFQANLGWLAVYVVPPGTYADGQTINWGAPVLQFDAHGILQVQAVQENLNQEIAHREAADTALDNAKLDKAGGTITGNLEVQVKLTLDANNVANVAFDD